MQLFATADWSTQIYDSGTVATYSAETLGSLDFGIDPLGSGVFDGFLGQKFSTVYFNRVLALSGIVTINDAGNSAGYVEASRLFGGEYTEFTYNPTGINLSWAEMTEQSRAEGGSLRSDGSIAFRELDINLEWVDKNQRAQLMDMFRYAGLRKDYFISVFPTAGAEKERDYTMLAKLTKMPKLEEASKVFDNYSTTLSFSEV